jgi:DNA polymerase-3 subunit beta
MRIVVATEKLRNALSKVVALAERKSVHSAYNFNASQGFVLFNAENGILTITAFDREVSIEQMLDCHIDEEGKFYASPKNLFFLIKELPETEINISLGDDNLVNITCTNISYSLVITKGDNFHIPGRDSDETPFDIPTDTMAMILNKTIGSMCSDDTKSFLNGVFLQQVYTDNVTKMRAVSTDGYYLTLIEVDMVKEPFRSLIEGATVPRRGVYEIKRLAESFPGGHMSITIDDSYIRANVNNCYFVTALLMAREFPNYQVVIPTRTEFSFNVQREFFLNSIRRIRLLCSNKANTLKLTIGPEFLTIVARRASVGFAEERLNIDYSGNPLSIALNAHHLSDVLGNYTNDRIIFEFNNEDSPVIVRSPSESNYFSVICPVKLEYF